jgi:hypothetical protein
LFSRLRIYESDIGGALQSMQMPSEIVGWVADFWATSSQHVLVIVDRLLRHFVLNPEHIVAWYGFVYLGSFSDITRTGYLTVMKLKRCRTIPCLHF